MIRTIAFASLFALSLPAVAQPLAAPPQPDSALVDYLMSSVDTLATSSDPRELWVAARVLKQVESSTLPPGEQDPENTREARTRIAGERDNLMRNALELGANDPMLAWIARSKACPASPSVCTRDASAARLRGLAPSNAATWWWSDGAASATAADGSTPDDLAQRLARIAAASRFDTYDGDLLRSLVRGLERTAVPDGLLQPAEVGASPASPSSVRAQLALEMAMADAALVGEQTIWSGCTARQIDAARRAQCEAAARVAMGKSGNQQAYLAGTRLLLALLPDGDARATVNRHARVALWQQEQFIELLTTGATPGEWAQRHVECLIQPGASELTCARRFVRASGRSLEPPASWRSRWESLPVGALQPG